MQEDKQPQINNTQRKALVNLLEKQFEKCIKEAQDKNGALVTEITDQVKQELGVKVIEEQIDQLEAKMELLKKTKERLGFTAYSVGGKAKMLIDQRTRKASKEIIALEQQRESILQKLWLTQTIPQAEKILAKVAE